MNADIIQGKWKEIKGDLQKTWGNITNDEWEKTKGDMKAVSGLIQQRYGKEKEDYAQRVADLYNKYISDPVHKKLEDTKKM
ncbi:MAG: CsbD family protein [Pseudobdellovibrio sp.]